MAGQAHRFASMLGLVQDDEPDYPQAYEGDDVPMGTVTEFPRHPGQHPGGAAEAMHQIVTVRPRRFDDATAVGDPFREGVPVIMNLSDVNDGDAGRLVDFCAGMVHSLRGHMERITPRVFLLSPATVQVTRDSGSGRVTSFDGGR